MIVMNSPASLAEGIKEVRLEVLSRYNREPH